MISKGYLTQCFNKQCDKTTRLALPLHAGQRWYCADCKADPAKSPEPITLPINYFPICVGEPYALTPASGKMAEDDAEGGIGWSGGIGGGG